MWRRNKPSINRRIDGLGIMPKIGCQSARLRLWLPKAAENGGLAKTATAQNESEIPALGVAKIEEINKQLSA
jgi:hypothetical protein